MIQIEISKEAFDEKFEDIKTNLDRLLKYNFENIRDELSNSKLTSVKVT